MDMLEENLSQFRLLAAETLDELWSSLATPDEASDISDTQALAHHIALIQKIQEAAASSGMSGLQAVCALVEANLSVIQSEGRGLNAAEQRLFEEWPELLMGFMIGKGDVNAIDGMILNLESPTWSLTLTAADGLEIRELLVIPQAEIQEPEILQQDITDVFAQVDITPIKQVPIDISPVTSESITALDSPHVELQVVDSDMLAMLNKEFALMDQQMNEDLATTVSAHYTSQQRRIALGNYMELIDRLGLASESVGLHALGKVFASIKQQLSNLNTAITSAQQALLEQLPGRISSYLTWPNDTSSCAALIDLLTDSVWQKPVSATEAPLWIEALATVEVYEGADQQVERQSEATAEDVSLAIPEDINAELLDGLLQELPLQTSAFTTAIERISTGQGNASDINRAMRAAHTLKGAANTVGVKGIANLTHHLEDILVALSEEAVMPNNELSAMLVNAGDCLEAMSEKLMGVGPEPAQVREVLQEVLNYANRIDREGISIFASNEILQIQHDVEHEVGGKKISTHDSGATEHVQGLRVSAPVVDELLRLAGETLISNSQIQDRLRQTDKPKPLAEFSASVPFIRNTRLYTTSIPTPRPDT